MNSSYKQHLIKTPATFYYDPFMEFDEEPVSPRLFLEILTTIMQRWPSEFDRDLFKQYHRYLALSEKEFRAHRTIEHQLRIICSHYRMQKHMLRHKQLMPAELDLGVRLLPTRLNFPFGQKSVLGVVIAIQLRSSYERFEDSHILLAIQKYLPQAQAIKESFLVFQKPGELLRLLYIEVEKTSSAAFSVSELGLLKNNLEEELKRRVETLNPSIFGINDVEETMRNIFSLSQELQFSSDPPQVMISFDCMLEKALVFRIIVARPVENTSKTLLECFRNIIDPFEYVHERTTIVGSITPDDKILKEASVFRLQIPKKDFLLRSDSSFNVYRARSHVLALLNQALGDVRDYNGGIFCKQLELFEQFKTSFPELEEINPELLEDFFYALRPPEVQAIIPLSSLLQLFTLFQEANTDNLSKHDSPILKIKQEEDQIFCIIHFRDSTFQDHIKNALENSCMLKELTAWMSIKNCGVMTLGYIYRSIQAEEQEKFYQTITDALATWVEKQQNIQVLRLAPQHLPVSLDPRLGGDEISGVILKMLFEGLTRIGKDGKPHFAIAKCATISEDGKCYTFKLKECTWNNGSPITAHDFCYTWKKILSPGFNSAFANLFYVILNAKKAKEGLVPVDKIGIQALDNFTLVVQLEHPCSYFLELTAHPLFYPVSHSIDRLHPNWPLQTGSAYICNGPFQLEHSNRQERYELKKNALYWDSDEVKLERIQISRANGREAVEMFNKDEVDWIGRPLSAWEPFFSKQTNLQIEQIPFTTSYWYVFNVKQFPFNSLKMRQAFADAINQEELISLLSYRATPSASPLPTGHTQFPQHNLRKRVSNAKTLFEEALKELGITRRTFPSVTLIHPNNELRKKIAWAIMQQWRETLGIVVEAETLTFKHLFKRMTKGDYQIGAMSWWPKIDDPIYTMNPFINADDPINFSKWENKSYKSFLERANTETHIKKRNYLLAKAEAILIREKPVIPLFHEIELFSKQKHVEGIFPSRVGNIDFKYAHINKAVKYAKNINPRTKYG